jgi:hypothetical protein
MRLLLLIQLIFLVSCATLPDRYIASEENYTTGNIVASESSVKLLPPKLDNHELLSFYLLLKADQKLVDVDLEDIILKHKKKIVKTKVRRISQGKYEVIVHSEITDISSMQFLVQNKKIQHKLKVFTKPSKNHSKISIVSNERHVLRLQLELGDKNGSAFQVESGPEIILEGIGQVVDLAPVGSGIWEFSIEYPEVNQVFYFSIRVNGVLLERIFRYQHVEK